MKPAIDVRGLRKAFGRQIVLDGLDLEVLPRRGLRTPRPERRRQDDDHQRAHDPHAPRRRHRHRRRDRRAPRPRSVTQRISLTGQSAAVDDVLTGTENLVMLGRLSGLSRSRREDARARAARALRTDGCRDQARRRLLRRHAPASRSRAQLRRHPRDPLPRRADDGPRHPQPARAVGRHPLPRRRGHDGVPHHAVPRRGRPARRPHRGARRRPRRRDRNRDRSSRPASAATPSNSTTSMASCCARCRRTAACQTSGVRSTSSTSPARRAS